MSLTRRTNIRRPVAQAALLASASFLSLTLASEAQAQCATSNADPVGNVTTNGTVVTCTGASNAQFVSAAADQVQVDIDPGATFDGGGVVFVIGNSGIVTVQNGATFDASTIYTLGTSNAVYVGGTMTASGVTVDGDNSVFGVDAGGSASFNPGALTVLASPTGFNFVEIVGTLSGASSNGSALITGGNGAQFVTIAGTLDVQADGLAARLGDGNDRLRLLGSANVTGGTGSNILFDGGQGLDRLQIDGSGTSGFDTVGFEALLIDAGTGGVRFLNGTHADLTNIRLQSGTTHVSSAASLGLANSDIDILSGARLVFGGTSAQTYTQNFLGAGQVVVDAANTVTTFGGNSGNFTGNFLIAQQSTALFTSGNVAGSGTITTNGTLQFGDFTIGNAIAGTGRVIKDGPGNAYLTGINTFSGGLFVEGGILEVYSVQSVGTGDISSSGPGGILAVTIAGNETLANNLTGNLALVKTGAGVLDLTGTNSYAGGTLIASGSLRVDDLARLGSGQVIANQGGNLILNYNGVGQLLQTTPFLTGAGGFIKEGSGDVVIDVANTYTGGTTIRSGTVGLNDGLGLGTGAIQVESGAILGIGGVTLSNDVSGSGRIVKTASNQANLLGDNSGFAGLIDIQGGVIVIEDGRSAGSGSVSIGSGTALQVASTVGDTTITANLGGAGNLEKIGTDRLTLTGTNTLTGNVFIDNGTLQIAGSQNIGTATINLANAGARLDLSTAGLTTLSNTVIGSGSIVKTGAGTVFITGANTYAGGTDIQQGAIRVSDVSVLGTGAITVQAGAALDLSIAGAQTLNQNITGAGILRKSGGGDLTLLGNGLTGGVDITNGRVIVTTANALGGGPVTTAIDTQLVFDIAGTEVSNTPISGAGALTKDGSGVLVIQNANTYTGGTIINAGRLGLNNGQGLGTGDVLVLQGAQLSIGGVSVANNIGGAGQVVKTASNAGFLTGTNTFSGGTDIQQGQLVVASPASLGTGGVQIASGAALVVDYSGSNAVTLGNALTGGGSLIKDGNGALMVLGTGNNYVGGTAINGGRVVVGNAGALGSGHVAVGSGAVVEIGAITLANNVSGAGRIVKTGSGAGALSGTNTHSGGVEIQGGSLAVSGNGALGSGGVSIAAGANLAYTNTGAATFANGLSGTGTFTKLGAGQLSFANNFTIGALNLDAGRTRINTIATTNATVASGATLDGTGRIIGNLVNNGTVAPGNSIGTLTVQGNYTHNAGSVLEIEFDANGNIDLLDVTGNAVLNGGTLRFVGVGGAEGQGGTFLRTGGSLTGTFATVETVGAQLPLSVFYQPNAALMAPSVLAARPSTFNAQTLAAADTALGFIDSIGLVDVRHGRGNRLWMSGFGAWGSRSASGTTLAYDHETRGISGGINLDVGANITLGGALGWAKGDIELGSNGGGGEQTHTLGSLTLRHETGSGFALGAGAVFGGVDQTTLRNVSFNGFAGSVDGETDSSILGFFAEAGVPLGAADGWTFALNARGSYVRQEQDAYTESGVSPLRLQLDELATETLEGQARLTAIKRLWDGNVSAEESAAGLDLRLDLGTRYLALSGDRAIPVVFAVSDAGVVLQGDTRDTVQGIGGIALEYTTRSGATFSLGYRGEIGKTDRHAAHAGVSIAF